jgi:hypothetical protein
VFLSPNSVIRIIFPEFIRIKGDTPKFCNFHPDFGTHLSAKFSVFGGYFPKVSPLASLMLHDGPKISIRVLTYTSARRKFYPGSGIDRCQNFCEFYPDKLVCTSSQISKILSRVGTHPLGDFRGSLYNHQRKIDNPECPKCTYSILQQVMKKKS